MKPSSSSVSSESKLIGVVAVRVASVAFRIVFFFASAAAVDLVEVRPARLAGDGGITAARAMMILLRVVCYGRSQLVLARDTHCGLGLLK